MLYFVEFALWQVQGRYATGARALKTFPHHKNILVDLLGNKNKNSMFKDMSSPWARFFLNILFTLPLTIVNAIKVVLLVW